uniref:Uncharacterized protein n=1 Tax=viral metagenome TaxID=1070528 RepID=A0A6H1ZI84_9ZZZZ
MKYRVRIDMSFDVEEDARALMEYAKGLRGKALSINEGKANAEISFCQIEECYHDEVPTRPCPLTPIERVEIRRDTHPMGPPMDSRSGRE